MPEWKVQIIRTGGPVSEAFLFVPGSKVGVICQHRIDSWEPLYGVKKVAGEFVRIPLPHCFILDDESIAVLDQELSNSTN